MAFWFLAIGVSSLMQSYSFAKSPTKGKQVSFFYTDFQSKKMFLLKTPQQPELSVWIGKGLSDRGKEESACGCLEPEGGARGDCK